MERCLANSRRNGNRLNPEEATAMNAITPPRRPPPASAPAPVTARPVPGSVTLTRIFRTGEAVDLGYVRVMFMGIALNVRLYPDGAAHLPHGVTLDPPDLADVEIAAHAGYLEMVIDTFAAQRERRRKSVSR
jgi:hypothetical protein